MLSFDFYTQVDQVLFLHKKISHPPFLVFYPHYLAVITRQIARLTINSQKVHQ